MILDFVAVFPKRGDDLSACTGSSAPVNEVGQQFFGLRPMKQQRLPVPEHFKTAEALDAQLIL